MEVPDVRVIADLKGGERGCTQSTSTGLRSPTNEDSEEGTTAFFCQSEKRIRNPRKNKSTTKKWLQKVMVSTRSK